MARWVRDESLRESWPSFLVFILICVLAFVPVVVTLAGSILAGSPPNFSVLWCLAVTPIAWIWLIVRVLGIASEQPSLPYLASSIRDGTLAQALGPRANELEASAEKLYQCIGLLNSLPVDKQLARSITGEAKARMRRIFDLSLYPAARYGLSRETAGQQVEIDSVWLTEACRLAEAMANTPIHDDLGLLQDLQARVTERDQALRELLQG